MLDRLRVVFFGLLFGLGLCGSGWGFSKLTFFTEALFAKNSDQLAAPGKARALELVQKADSARPEVIVVTGHSDKSEKVPEGLSLRRAKAVKFYLMQVGVAPSLIYTEGIGARQMETSSPSHKNRRVDLEFVGLSGSFAKGQGFATMNAWKLDGDPSSSIQDEWSALGPIEFARHIVDPQAKLRFVNQLALAAIHRNDDGLLKVALAMRQQKPSIFITSVPPALYAQAFGSLFAKEILAAEIAQIPDDEPRRLEYARSLWCDQTHESSPTFVRQAVSLLPSPRVLALLPSVQQQAWVFCAARLHKFSELRWLAEQGVSMDATDADKRSALHSAVSWGELESVQELLSSGASTSVSDAQGDTPLHLVDRASRGSNVLFGPTGSWIKRRLWNALIAAGADPLAKNAKGEVPVEPSPEPSYKVN